MKNVMFFLFVWLTLQFMLAIDIFSQAPEKCGTFSPEVLAKIGLACNRPVLSSTEYTIESTNFIIHFTSDDPPPLEIIPSDDKTTYLYAQKVKIAAEEAWNFQINNLGWQAPPSDGTCGGGDGKYDIYIKGLNYYGVTTPETEEPGTNGYSSYIEITTKLLRSDDVYTPLTDDEIKVTIAHEFNHALQFGYNGTKLSVGSVNNSWFYENTATWMEEIQYPNINEWITYFLNNPSFASPLKEPYLPINHISNQYQYSGALFCHLLSRWFNNNFIKNIWMFASQSSSSFLSDINSVLLSNDQSLKTALKRYALWRYFTGQRDDGNHFPKGHLYPTAKVLRAHSDGTGSGSSSPDNLSSVGGTSYITYRNANGVININFDGQNDTEFSVIALNKRIHFSDMENNFTLNTSNDGSVNNLSCIGEDHVILIPVVTKWQNQQSGITYGYSSVLGSGVTTSFWTEKENTNITEGTLSVQLSSPIPSGHSRSLANQLSYREITNFERFSNFQGKSVKHNNWNLNMSDYLLNNDFLARIENNKQTAKYNFLEYSKIQIMLEGNLISSKGSGSFHDPWYVLSNGSQPANHWIDFTTEYEPTGKEGAVEKGVFLNQGWPGWNPPYYSVKAEQIQNISLSNSGRTHKFYFQNWVYDPNKISLQYPNFLETGVVFKETNALLSANYKGTQLTDDNETYSNNNQRKAIKTPDGLMHSVYESNGSIFYEISNDNGDNWLINDEINVKDQNPSWDIFDPVIDYYVNGDLTHIVIGFILQREDPAGDWLRTYQYYYEDEESPTKASEESIPPLALESEYEYLSKPTLAINENGDFVIFVVKTSNGKSELRWSAGEFSTECNMGNYCFGFKNSGIYYSSQNNQDNPVVSALKNNSSNKFHLAYQENEQIKYDDVTLSNNNLTNINPITLSTGSGYLYNRYPSLIVMNDNYARVTWQGTRYEEEEVELGKIKKEGNQNRSGEITRIVFKSSDYYYFWSFGNNTGKPNINRHSTAYAVAWSENNGSSVKFIDQISNNIIVKTISNISGKDVQVTNGSSLSDMYAVSLNATAAPYYFMKSNSLNTFNKPNLLTISSGREGVVYNGGAEFYFAIGDIKLNGNNTDFVEIPDSVKTLNLSLLNEYLRSQTLSVDNTSQLLYSVQYGMIDSTSTQNYLQTGKTITFGVELVDAITNNVLGRYDEVTFDENNMFNYDKQGYEVSLEGIGTNREVYLRLSTTSNDETSGYSLTQRYSDETILGKTHTKKINYTGTEKPTEYALYQNYPNPFNPVTTITYQIPKEGLVTLKIYDILGKEVTTLINEEKQAGKYSIDFNASKLSSGVYLYELRSNDYKSTKKLLLMK